MDCPVCRSPRSRPLATDRRAYFRCGDCGFAWVAPSSLPDQATARVRYALHRNEEGDAGYVSYLSAIIDRAVAFAGPSVRSVVDWGSGPNPVCASLLRERGFEVAIWDPAFAPDTPPPLSFFDLALCIEVAEHFLDPLSDFLALSSRLKPGGYAVFHTHLAPEKDEDFLRWWYIEDITHVAFYTEAALRMLGRKASLAVVAVEAGKLAVFRKPLPVLVAGGANLDIEGRPHERLVAADSNPGIIRFAPGGAGRNVAEDLARLGMAVQFVSAIGSDSAGLELAEKTAAAGVGTVGFERLEGETTSCYLSDLDADGDMAKAVNAKGIYDPFDAPRTLAAAERSARRAAETSFVAENRHPFSALVLDGNLLPVAAEALLDRFAGLPAWLDPVSTPKGRRFAQYRGGALLARLAAAKPNLMEAEAMAAVALVPDAEVPAGAAGAGAVGAGEAGVGIGERAARAARALHSSGVGVIYVSLGTDGVYRLGADAAYRLSSPPVEVVSATGAGDAYLAGSLRAFLLGLDAQEEGAAGSAAAAAALASTEACPPDLDGTKLEDQISAWRRAGAIAWKEE